jgi:hypothetical protein
VRARDLQVVEQRARVLGHLGNRKAAARILRLTRAAVVEDHDGPPVLDQVRHRHGEPALTRAAHAHDQEQR